MFKNIKQENDKNKDKENNNEPLTQFLIESEWSIL